MMRARLPHTGLVTTEVEGSELNFTNLELLRVYFNHLESNNELLG